MSNSLQTIQRFMKVDSVAIVGVSRNRDKFGTAIYREMKTRDYKVFAVNPNADMIEGDRCYAGLGALPELPGGVIIVIPPEQVIPIIDEAAKLGIRLLWIQQGANSIEAEKRCQALGLEYVSGECIFMFLEPVESIHTFHRFFKRLFGRMPA